MVHSFSRGESEVVCLSEKPRKRRIDGENVGRRRRTRGDYKTQGLGPCLYPPLHTERQTTERSTVLCGLVVRPTSVRGSGE